MKGNATSDNEEQSQVAVQEVQVMLSVCTHVSEAGGNHGCGSVCWLSLTALLEEQLSLLPSLTNGTNYFSIGYKPWGWGGLVFLRHHEPL